MKNNSDRFIRINKFIATGSTYARRKADELILEGRVTINGVSIHEPGYQIDPDKDKVHLDGELIRVNVKKVYIILFKPEKIITSVSDEKRRTTVIDIIKSNERIFPVGRLDYDTSGLLLLTNDGEFANKLMHPKFKVDKKYIVKLSKPLEEKHRIKIESGIVLEGKRTSKSKIEFPVRGDYSTVKITLHEGRNHQVKNMFEHYGYFVRKLHRSDYGKLNLKGLKPGEWRYLTAKETESLIK